MKSEDATGRCQQRINMTKLLSSSIFQNLDAQRSACVSDFTEIYNENQNSSNSSQTLDEAQKTKLY